MNHNLVLTRRKRTITKKITIETRLASSDKNTQKLAIHALSKRHDDRSANILAIPLHDPDNAIRRAAAGALGRIASFTAMSVLWNELGKKTVPTLIAALCDPNIDYSLRYFAASTLVTISKDVNKPGSYQFFEWGKSWDSLHLPEILIKKLENQDPTTRSLAIFILGGIGSNEACPFIIKKLRDPVNYVKDMAAFSLINMDDSRCIAPLGEAMEDGQLRKFAAQGLIYKADDQKNETINTGSGPAAIFTLIGKLHTSKNRWVRREAALALGHISDEIAIEDLKEALHDDSKVVRQAAILALKNIGQEIAEEVDPWERKMFFSWKPLDLKNIVRFRR